MNAVSIRTKSLTDVMGCFSISLEIFGDRWSLLIVRDFMFNPRRTFKEFAEAGEGIATNVLADRLERLEAAGIITRRTDASDCRRALYRLTQKGMELAPVLVEMVIWAARNEDTDAPRQTVQAMRRDRQRFIAAVRAQWAKPLPTRRVDAGTTTAWA